MYLVFGILGCSFSICLIVYFVAVGVFWGLVMEFLFGILWCVFGTLVVYFVNVSLCFYWRLVLTQTLNPIRYIKSPRSFKSMLFWVYFEEETSLVLQA